MARRLDDRNRPSTVVTALALLLPALVGAWALGWIPGALLPLALLLTAGLMVLVSVLEVEHGYHLPESLPEGLLATSKRHAAGAIDDVPVSYRVEMGDATPTGYLSVVVPLPHAIAVHPGAERRADWLGTRITGDERLLYSLFDAEARVMLRALVAGDWLLEDGALHHSFPLSGGADDDLGQTLAIPVSLSARLRQASTRPIGERLRAQVLTDPDPGVRLGALQAMSDEELALLPELEDERLLVELALRRQDLDALQRLSRTSDPGVRMLASQRLVLLLSDNPELAGAVSMPVEELGALSLVERSRAQRSRETE